MNRLYILTIAAAFCFAGSLPLATAQGNSNGKGNANKEAATEKANEKQKDKQNNRAEGRGNRSPRLKDVVEQKKAEAAANHRGNNAGNKPEKEAKGNGKGNAYGKNKGELSGREFGLARAEAAKLNGQQKREQLSKTVITGDTKVTEARGRLSRAIEELERKRKAGTITDAEYNEKQVTISRTQKAIQVLEERINTAKVLVTTPIEVE